MKELTLLIALVFSSSLFAQEAAPKQEDRRVNISFKVLTQLLQYLETQPHKDVNVMLRAVEGDAVFIAPKPPKPEKEEVKREEVKKEEVKKEEVKKEELPKPPQPSKE